MSSKEDGTLKKSGGSVSIIGRLRGRGELYALNLKMVNDRAEQRLSEFLDKEFDTHAVDELAVFPQWLTDEAIAYYCAMFDGEITALRRKEERRLRVARSAGVGVLVAGLSTAALGGVYAIVGALGGLVGLALTVGASRAFPQTPGATVGNQDLFVLLSYQSAARERLRRINRQRGNAGNGVSASRHS